VGTTKKDYLCTFLFLAYLTYFLYFWETKLHKVLFEKNAFDENIIISGTAVTGAVKRGVFSK